MIDAKDEKEFYIEVKFIKYGTYTIHATSKEHAMQMYHDGSWSDYMKSMMLMMKKYRGYGRTVNRTYAVIGGVL
ncbi:MAG: hypothetical protein CM15mV20_0570 [uncultured marine virus]|nr:MAG: hypothetical protein CM15mV20_0570 [uncultured marine virus]